MIIFSVVASALLWAKPTNPPVWVALFTLVYLGALGFVDDYLKVTRKNSKGVSGRIKLAAQFLLAAIVVMVFLHGPRNAMFSTDVYVPFLKRPLFEHIGVYAFGLLALVFYGLVIVGCSNAVNLTDGLDGLAAGVTVTVVSSYAVLAFAASNNRVTEYLAIPFFPGSGELTVLCAAMAGAGLGFLWFNAHPAQVFMGDTGSLAIGGFIAIIAICCKQELLLILVGGVFVMEAVSDDVLVDLGDAAGERGEEVGGDAGAFDRGAGFAFDHFPVDLGELDEDDLAHRFLLEVGDADGERAVVLEAHPLVVPGVACLGHGDPSRTAAPQCHVCRRNPSIVT